ncbi:MAG: electron transporter RnfG [Candidatus Nealsonbacteria bacterium]|nr:MAG: electron transporter RnfG [Candidatus Nealsonbacteria bacterium]
MLLLLYWIDILSRKFLEASSLRKSIQMVLVLSIVGMISGASLVGVYKYTQPKIEQNKKEEIRRAIFEVIPQAKSYKTIVKEDKLIYQGLDSSGNLVGYAFTGEGPGYQGTIEIMIGMDSHLNKVTGIQILESVETPGLGAKITSKAFRDQFRALVVLPLIELIKRKKVERPNQIQAITGATISSQAVVDILNKTIKETREKLLKE